MLRLGQPQLYGAHVRFRPKADIARVAVAKPDGQAWLMTTKTGYDALLDVVCVTWGFCGCVKNDKPLHVDDLIPPSGPVTADQFVEWVFLADNLNPNSEPEKWQRHKDAIRAAFIEHMGGEVVEAECLR